MDQRLAQGWDVGPSLRIRWADARAQRRGESVICGPENDHFLLIYTAVNPQESVSEIRLAAPRALDAGRMMAERWTEA